MNISSAIKITISRQLTLLAVLAIAMLAIVGLTGQRIAESLQAAADYSETRTIPSVEAIGAMRLSFVEIREATLNHSTSWNGEEKKQLDQHIAELKKHFADAAAEYEKLAADDEAGRALLEADRKAYAEYIALTDQVREISSGNRNEAAQKLFSTTKDKFAALNDSLTKHNAHAKARATESRAAANAAAMRNNRLASASIILGILIVGSFCFVISRSINKRLTSMEEVISHVDTELDLTARVPVKREDEIGVMGLVLNHLLERLQRNLQSVSRAATEVSDASEAMKEASARVADVSATQNDAATNMASKIQELTLSIGQVSARADETRSRAAYAGELASEGERVVDSTVNDIHVIAQNINTSAQLIGDLEQQSATISSVVQVIKEVADQTNLLALNAAIEAARAGEQGRGFAVVADEVRKLAERTGKSTEEIAATINLIRQSAEAAARNMRGAVEQVNASVARAGEAGEKIRRIGEGSRAAEAMVTEITAAIQEQSSASTSAAQSVEQIAQMAAQGTATAADSARTAERLDRLAHDMRAIADQYKLSL